MIFDQNAYITVLGRIALQGLYYFYNFFINLRWQNRESLSGEDIFSNFYPYSLG